MTNSDPALLIDMPGSRKEPHWFACRKPNKSHPSSPSRWEGGRRFGGSLGKEMVWISRKGGNRDYSLGGESRNENRKQAKFEFRDRPKKLENEHSKVVMSRVTRGGNESEKCRG